jgi:hypothetical protein
MRWLGLALLSLIAPMPIQAGEADILAVEVTRDADGSYRFDVTVQHADTGWEHYADAFEVLAPDGTVLGTRTLLHPHVDEQPFTRSLAGVSISDGITQVIARARDSVHGYAGSELTVALPR